MQPNSIPQTCRTSTCSVEDSPARHFLTLAADGALQAVRVQFRGGRIYEQPCEKLVLAIGHSARDTFEMLYEAGIAVAAKPF